MKLDSNIKIKKHKDYPIGIVINAPKKYLGYYYIQNGTLKFKKQNKKKALKNLTYWINNRAYLFEKNE